MLHGLRQAAFETESESGLSNERRRSLCAKEFKKLGFSVSVTSCRNVNTAPQQTLRPNFKYVSCAFCVSE